jgi:hypothetical protein
MDITNSRACHIEGEVAFILARVAADSPIENVSDTCDIVLMKSISRCAGYMRRAKFVSATADCEDQSICTLTPVGAGPTSSGVLKVHMTDWDQTYPPYYEYPGGPVLP